MPGATNEGDLPPVTASRLGLFLAGVALSCLPVRAETLLERGTYLMNGIVACGNCHTPQTENGPRPGKELAGQLVLETEAFTAYAPNITPDKETGIGSWSDEEIITAIREGRRPDGTIIGPPMPFELYRDISDRDARAIVAYLRSVPAVKSSLPKSTYSFPLPPSYGPEVASVAEPAKDDPVAYGRYLVEALGHCTACHSPLVNGVPDLEHQRGAGGQPIPGPWGIAVSANITPHEDGIGEYTDEEIKRAITGILPDGGEIGPPMAVRYYRNISDQDLDAMVAFLRTLPPKPTP